MFQLISYNLGRYTAQKKKFSIKDFFSKCDQIRRKLRIWSHLLKKFLMENIFCAVTEDMMRVRLKEYSEQNIVYTNLNWFLKKWNQDYIQNPVSSCS